MGTHGCSDDGAARTLTGPGNAVMLPSGAPPVRLIPPEWVSLIVILTRRRGWIGGQHRSVSK